MLAKLAAGLVPGGRVLIEDLDWGSYGPALPSAAAEATIAAVTRSCARPAWTLLTGCRLMRGLGPDRGGRRGPSAHAARREPVRWSRCTGRLSICFCPGCSRGLLTAEDADAFHARFDDPEYDMITQTMMAVWGRRPGP